jgi:hypothetical protein
VSGGIRRGRRCPEGCPIVASIVDAGHDRVDDAGHDRVDMDGDQACGRSGIEHGCRWSRRVGPGAGSGWGWPKASMRIVVLSGHGQDERAAWLAVVGWPGAWSDAGRLSSCPVMARMSGQRGWPWSAGQAHGRTLGGGGVRRLAVAVRTGSVPIGWAVTLNWDVRTVERSAMSVARPATAGCPQEELVGGDGVQAGVRRLHPGGSGRPAGLRACPARHGRGPRGAHRAVQGWRAGRRAAPARRPAFATDRADGRGWRRGGSLGIGKWLPSVGASGPGALLGGGSPLAAGESLGTSCSDRASIQNSKDTSR